MIYRPVRERDPQQVVGHGARRALDKSGQDEVSLTALSTADVSAISPLIKRLAARTAPERVSLGVASLRAYGLAEDLLDDMRKVRANGLTFAPEAGTQRMRDVINKNVTEAAAARNRRARVQPRLRQDEALLHLRTADRNRGRRARHHRGRKECARRRQTHRRATHRDRQRQRPRTETAHAVSMVRDGRSKRDRAKAGALARSRPGRAWPEAANARLDREHTRRRARARRPAAGTE